MAFLNENGLHALRECCDALYLSKADASNIYLSKGDAEHLPYLPLSGGTMTGQIKQESSSGNYGFVNSKETCCFYRSSPNKDANHYYPVIGMESVDGGTLSIGASAGAENSKSGSAMSFVYNPKGNTSSSNTKRIYIDIAQKGLDASSASLASYNASNLTFSPMNVGDANSCVYFSSGVPKKGRTIKCGTGAVTNVTGMAVGDIYIKYE